MRRQSTAPEIMANEEALANAWHNLQVAVAGPQSENVIRILKELTGVLNGMQMSLTACRRRPSA